MFDKIRQVVGRNALVVGAGSLVLSMLGVSGARIGATSADCGDYVCTGSPNGDKDCQAVSCTKCHTADRCVGS